MTAGSLERRCSGSCDSGSSRGGAPSGSWLGGGVVGWAGVLACDCGGQRLGGAAGELAISAGGGQPRQDDCRWSTGMMVGSVHSGCGDNGQW
jgi:hypothetical protein